MPADQVGVSWRRHAARSAVCVGAMSVTAAMMAVGISRPFNYDEAVTVRNFVAGTPSLLWPFRFQVVWNNHPFFSFLERIVWAITGSASPTAMRLLPILVAAAAVGLLAFLAARELGIGPAVIAAVVMVSNPMFFTNASVARGYGLVVLCGVAATAALVAIVRAGVPRARVEIRYVAVVAIAIATHLYAIFLVIGHVGFVAGRRRLSLRWVVRWVGGTAIGLTAYVGMWAYLPLGDRPRVFRADLPWDVTWALLGGSWWLAVPVAALCAVGLSNGWRDLGHVALLAALGVGFVIVWVAVANFDTYPRFFVWGVPGVAWAAATGARPVIDSVVADRRRRRASTSTASNGREHTFVPSSRPVPCGECPTGS
jgi:hypothetical protein